jgi:Zn-dependent protease
VTLNPLAHIDPIGIICLVFVGFGWGRPVQVNPNAFKKNRRLCNFITDIAGVCTNFICAFAVTGILFALLSGGAIVYGGTAFTILYYTITMNIVLMVFNLLPIPPLDGFGIITEIFDLRHYSWYRSFYQYGSLILMILLIVRIHGNSIISLIFTPALSGIFGFISKIWSVILL